MVTQFSLFFYANFLNVHFSMPYKYFKICMHSLHIHSEGTVSQIFNPGLGFYFVKKRETVTELYIYAPLFERRYD